MRLPLRLGAVVAASVSLLVGCGGAGRPPISPNQVYTAFLHHGFVLEDNPIDTGAIIHSFFVPGPGDKMYGGIDVYRSVRDAAKVEPSDRRAYGRRSIVARANVIVQIFNNLATGPVRQRMLRAIASLP